MKGPRYFPDAQEMAYLVTTIALNVHMAHILCTREILVNQQMLIPPPSNLQVVEVSESSLSVAWDIVQAQQPEYVIVLFKGTALSDGYNNTAKSFLPMKYLPLRFEVLHQELHTQSKKSLSEMDSMRMAVLSLLELHQGCLSVGMECLIIVGDVMKGLNTDQVLLGNAILIVYLQLNLMTAVNPAHILLVNPKLVRAPLIHPIISAQFDAVD